MRRPVQTVLVLAVLLALASPAVTGASYREHLVAPHVTSYARTSRHVCLLGAASRKGANVVHTLPRPCTANYAPILVRRGRVIVVTTPKHATRARLLAQRSRLCRRVRRGRFACRMPAYGTRRQARVRLAYPDGSATWRFDIKTYRPVTRTKYDPSSNMQFTLTGRRLTMQTDVEANNSSDADEQLDGHRVNAGCSTSAKKAITAKTTRRWPKGARTVTWTLSRDVSYAVRYCLVEHADGGDIGVAWFPRG